MFRCAIKYFLVFRLAYLRLGFESTSFLTFGFESSFFNFKTSLGFNIFNGAFDSTSSCLTFGSDDFFFDFKISFARDDLGLDFSWADRFLHWRFCFTSETIFFFLSDWISFLTGMLCGKPEVETEGKLRWTIKRLKVMEIQFLPVNQVAVFVEFFIPHLQQSPIGSFQVRHTFNTQHFWSLRIVNLHDVLVGDERLSEWENKSWATSKGSTS